MKNEIENKQIRIFNQHKFKLNIFEGAYSPEIRYFLSHFPKRKMYKRMSFKNY